MKKIFPCFLFVIFCFALPIFAQIPISTLVQISRAEDELRFDKTLENLMISGNAQIRARAALASGRIGKEKALPFLINLLEKDSDVKVRATAAFAIGEIESIKGADAILRNLQNTGETGEIRARAIEAAGKIAAANAKDEKSKLLGKAILDALKRENITSISLAERNFVLFGITAVLRARPDGGEAIAAKFLNSNVARIRADAANTLSRLRAKNANDKLRSMLLSDNDAIARANAARALGAAEDKDAFDLLLNAAVSDKDSRARVSAIRSLGGLKDAKAADKLLERGEILLTDYKKSKFANPIEKNELLEIATTLGRILPNTSSERAIKFLKDFRVLDQLQSPETEIAFARIAPEIYLQTEPFSGTAAQVDKIFPKTNWQSSSNLVQGLAEFANLPDEKKHLRLGALVNFAITVSSQESHSPEIIPAIPDHLRAYAAFRKEVNSPDLQVITVNPNYDYLSHTLRGYVTYKEKTAPEPFRIVPADNRTFGYNDVIVRATAAELLGEQPSTKENIETLKTAFKQALIHDKELNDAQLSILSALVKLDKQQSFESLRLALNAPDYLVRRRAADLVKENNLAKDFRTVEEAFDTLKPYDAKTGTKLGQILNSNADYIRAVSRKSARAILTTEKGTFTIEFSPEAAPLTVDNFIKLAKGKYFDGLAIHRVVPNFVMQDGDPRGDGNGGPGWEIRDELNMLPYERGAVGMALSGKDTGGSQWFVTHSPQPHLDGGYTVFGRVNETDMKIVDNLVRGDKILSVKIIEGNFPQRKSK